VKTKLLERTFFADEAVMIALHRETDALDVARHRKDRREATTTLPPLAQASTDDSAWGNLPAT
jgi:hypothetical protein